MSNALAKKDPLASMTGFKTVSIKELDDETKQVLKDSVAKGTTDSELVYFLNVALAQDLNPFAKEVWCVKYGNSLMVQTSRDGFLKIAKRDPNFSYIQSAEVREGDIFSLDAITGKVEHRITAKRGQIIGAYALITRKDGVKIAKYLTYSECKKDTTIWKSNPTAMMCARVESALAKQFANVTGIVGEEGMDKQGVIIDSSPSVEGDHDSLKMNFLSQISSCQTIGDLEALKPSIAADIGKLFEIDRNEVMDAAIQKSAELKSISADTVSSENKPKRGRPKKQSDDAVMTLDEAIEAAPDVSDNE